MPWTAIHNGHYRSAGFSGVVGLCLLNAIVGCGGSKGGTKERIYPIKATLTLDGQPIGPMFVMLHSTKPNGPMIAGETDEKGNIRFTTNRVGDGAPEGEYKLEIPKDPLGRAVTPVPDVYRDFRTTPLTVKVEPKKNELKFALDSKAELSAGDSADPTMGNFKKPKPVPGRKVKQPEPPPVPKVDPKLVR
jgi:hypothetical protein